MHALTHIFQEFRSEPGRVKLIVDGITETVGGSFIADRSTQTRNEVRRRAEICAELFMSFRKDMHWSTVRALDELPKALRCKLDGIDYTPPEGDRWAADNGRDLIYMPG